MATILKNLYRIIIYIGFIFFGGGFLISFGQFIIYNGIGDFFEYIPANENFVYKEMDKMPTQFRYEYIVDNKRYKDSQNVSTQIIKELDTENVVVLYNKTFNCFSMLQGIKGKSSKVWDQTIGMIVFGFFFLFIFVIYKFANIDKWIGIYSVKK